VALRGAIRSKTRAPDSGGDVLTPTSSEDEQRPGQDKFLDIGSHTSNSSVAVNFRLPSWASRRMSHPQRRAHKIVYDTLYSFAAALIDSIGFSWVA
jgi:hypothetical protein